MIDKTVLLLTPFEDCSRHKVGRYIGYLNMSVPFDECIHQPLKKLFPRVILYDYLKQMVDNGISAMNQEIIDLAKKERPQYVFWVAFGDYYEVRESTLLALRQAGSKVIAWFFDDEVRFDFYSRWWVPYVDYFGTNDPEAVAKYRALGAWATYAIPDTGEPLSRDWRPAGEKYDVSFVGSLRADRDDYIRALKNRNIPVSLFGLSFGNFVSYPEMAEIFHNSKINLNFSKTYRYMKSGVKGRIFKVCLAGGFLLTEYFPGLEDYFEIGREIDCFHDKQELLEKIDYYLSHDAERRAIARAGWTRACSQHTASHVVERFIGEVERAEAQSPPQHTTIEPALPAAVRRRQARYYKMVAIAFFWANHKGLWEDAFRLVLYYDRFDIGARLHRLIGLLPPWPRRLITIVEIAANRLFGFMYLGFGHVPHLRKVKRELTVRLRYRHHSSPGTG
ncbi:MAG: glycosyltransferase [Chloroflexi bacterium]|nr:glycosyltransferase [Chloroflexota bacterium]